VTESGQRVRNPRKRWPPEQPRLSPGRAGGTKAEHRLVDSALPDVARFALLRPRYILLSDVNLVSQSPVQGHVLEFWPSRTVFSSPCPGIPLHPRARNYRRLKSCCLRCSASTCCPHLVSAVTGEDRRIGCGPVTHLFTAALRRAFVGSGWTRTDRVEWVLRPYCRGWAWGVVSRASVPPRLHQYPNWAQHTLSVPRAHKRLV
jgi:hypothetical protein